MSLKFQQSLLAETCIFSYNRLDSSINFTGEMLYLGQPVKRACVTIAPKICIVYMIDVYSFSQSDCHAQLDMRSSSLRRDDKDDIRGFNASTFSLANFSQAVRAVPR